MGNQMAVMRFHTGDHPVFSNCTLTNAFHSVTFVLVVVFSYIVHYRRHMRSHTPSCRGICGI